MSSFGVFSLTTGALELVLATTDLSQVQIQALPGSGRVVLEGDYSRGRWVLGEDGWPVDVTEAPAVTVAQVKHAARRRLAATDWKVARHRDQVDSGQPTSLTEAEYQALLVERQAIRAASNRIEALTPIPADFWADHHWQEPPHE